LRVRFFAYIRDFTKCAEADIPYKETIGALALSLCDLYGEPLRRKIFVSGNSGEMQFGPEIIFLINGRHVAHLGGPAAPLGPDDRVDVFPVVAGG
jgi:molybdopterin synthase sulfur carrier subunit